MTTGKDLIDKAAKVCGGYKALAERLEIPAPNVSLMKAGKRAISPATAAELADIAGEDAREAAIDAIKQGYQIEGLSGEFFASKKAGSGRRLSQSATPGPR